MSGRGKRILYYAITTAAGLASVACAVLTAYSAALEWANLPSEYLAVFIAAPCTLLLLKPGVVIHELGHLLVGACAGMKGISFSVGFINISRGKGVFFQLSPAAGETQVIPRTSKNLRRRMMAATLGGIAMNFVVGATVCVLFFMLPKTPALVFFALLAPFQLYEGIAAVLPAELGAGRTDGALFSELRRNTAESDVFLRVLAAQGMLEKGEFSDLPRSLLFDASVVREDSAAFLSLLHLRFQYLLYLGDEGGAAQQIFRLEELSEYLPSADSAQVLCDASFMRYILNGTMDFEAPKEAKKTAAYNRIAAVKEAKINPLKRSVQKERSLGIRKFEEMLLKKYIGKRT